MSDATDHIAAWEAAGVIDPRTADRLRAAEAGLPIGPGGLGPRPRGQRGTTVAAVFGPGVSIGEMFGYLGLAFLLAAFNTFVGRLAGPTGDSELAFGIGFAVQALALAALGIGLRSGDARRRRAAGVAFLAAVADVATAVALLAGTTGMEWPQVGVLAAAFALLAAVGARLYHPALLTQVALLGSLTGLAVSCLAWIEATLVPPRLFDELGNLEGGGPDPAILAVASAIWWALASVIVGLIGLRESWDATDDPPAGRRAALSRLWAGGLIVVGVSTSLMKTEFLPDGSSGRVIEPAIAEVVLIVICAVLVERAFRREASTYVYAAALGLVIALTDFNLTFLSQSAEMGLLIEGLILLGAGVAADRLRRRLGAAADDGADEIAPGLAPIG